MSDDLTILAGKHARALTDGKEFCPELVRVMAGATGGLRWLVLHRLD